MRGPKPETLNLSEAEQNELKALVHRHTTPQQHALRGRMILAAADGKNNSQMACELKVCVDTVRAWRGRWLELQAIPLADPERDKQIKEICGVYHEAPGRTEQGERTVSTDELTGVLALERKHPGLPLVPGKVERREFEYIRHGTRSFILSRDIVTGQILAPTCGPTRTEADFLAHVQALVNTSSEVKRWHLACDQLNTHQSASLVEWVAKHDGVQEDLGVKGQSGILASMTSRAPFLADPTHSVVFHYTPKHSSWMNQIEIWLSILVRKLLKRGSFTSVEDLRTKVMAFIDYYNRTMAKPFQWTYQGKALTM